MAETRARWGPTLGVAVLAAFLLPDRGVRALTPSEREDIVKSVREGELATVEKALGGLDSLPLVKLDLELDPERGTVEGTARLDWPNTTGKPLVVLPVRLASNSDKKGGPVDLWKEIQVTMPGGASTTAKVVAESAWLLRVMLPGPLMPGQRVILEGHLKGRMTKLEAGATDPIAASMSAISGTRGKKVSDQYGKFACGEHICTVAEFAPDVPAWIDGKFDTEPESGIGDWPYGEPVNLIMDVTADTAVHIFATAVALGQTPAPKLMQRNHFAMAATREIGFVASSAFYVQHENVDGVVVRSVSLEADKKGGADALKAAVESMRTYDQAFGRYPWSFLNIAESELIGGAGGDELPGLDLNGSAFYNGGGGSLGMLGLSSSASGGLIGGMLDFITRHEVAHEWWYAVVGSHPQLHPYIDEPLAQWSALYSVEQNEGPEAAAADRTMQVAVNFQALPMLGLGDGKVARPAGEFESAVEYAGLVYGKAPLFFDAAAKRFGEDRIIAGLRAFAEENRFKRATPEGEIRALEQAVGASHATELRHLWHHWFDEKHGEKDVGGLDMGSVAAQLGLPGGGQGMQSLQGLLGGGNAQNIDPKSLQQLQQLLGGTGTQNGGTTQNVDPKTMEDAMKLLNDLMDNAEKKP